MFMKISVEWHLPTAAEEAEGKLRDPMLRSRRAVRYLTVLNET